MIPLKDNIPTDRLPIVTIAIIIASILVFVLQMQTSSQPGSAPSPVLAQAGFSARDQQTIEYGAIPREVTRPGEYCAPIGPRTAACDSREAIQDRSGVDQKPWFVTLLTSMFMHGDLLHIGFNMLFLWIFGNNVEDSMGRGRFAAFYLLGGVAATYMQAAFNLSGFESTVPQIGASGAIAAVLGGYLLLYPRAKVLTVVFVFLFFTFIEIPAAIVLTVWLILQFVPAIGQEATSAAGEGGVAYWAHVGGFIFGLLLIRLFAKRRKQEPSRPAYPVY